MTEADPRLAGTQLASLADTFIAFLQSWPGGDASAFSEAELNKSARAALAGQPLALTVDSAENLLMQIIETLTAVSVDSASLLERGEAVWLRARVAGWIAHQHSDTELEAAAWSYIAAGCALLGQIEMSVQAQRAREALLARRGEPVDIGEAQILRLGSAIQACASKAVIAKRDDLAAEHIEEAIRRALDSEPLEVTPAGLTLAAKLATLAPGGAHQTSPIGSLAWSSITRLLAAVRRDWATEVVAWEQTADAAVALGQPLLTADALLAQQGVESRHSEDFDVGGAQLRRLTKVLTACAIAWRAYQDSLALSRSRVERAISRALGGVALEDTAGLQAVVEDLATHWSTETLDRELAAAYLHYEVAKARSDAVGMEIGRASCRE